MNKRIKALLLCFVMVFEMLVTAVPVFAFSTETAQVELSVTPDKTEASPGDTITYTVKIGPVKKMRSISFTLIIPEGLVYGSGKEVDGLKDILGAAAATYNTNKQTLAAYGNGSYTSEAETTLLTFTCTVGAGTVGKSLEIGIDEDWDIADDEDETYPNVKLNTADSKVTITAAPKPATGISLNKGSLSLYTGNSETLYAAVTPTDSTDTVAWSSDKTNIATVDATGKVTAVAPGTAIITAKAGSKTATCTVTVTNAPCEHTTKTTILEKASTCKDRGWDAYKKCEDCEQLFNDSDAAIDEIPYRSLSTTHVEGTPATCKNRAVCSICSQPYGDLAAHNYTKEDKTNPEALMTAGNCKDEAKYYYSCTVCGAVEKNAAHTFNGDKVPDNHTGGTEIKNYKAPDHKNQIDGYEGDTYCLGCGEKIADGKVLPAGTHVPSEGWQWDETHHWKVCSVEGCGIAIESTKAAHAHRKDEWKKDAGKHWHECECGHKADEAEHIPGPAATETTPQTCTECGYEIAPMLGHTCAVKDTVTDKPASCTADGNSKYYICRCGKWYSDEACENEIIDKESVKINALGHDYSEQLEDDAHLKEAGAHCQQYNTYWYDCSRCDSNAKDDSQATDKFFTSTTKTGNHSFDTENWGYRGTDGHAHKCKYCDAHETPLTHQDNGWQYDFPKKEKFKVCKDCGYEMDRIGLVSFSVSFYANGGSGSMSSMSVLEGTELTFPANGFTAPEGQVFTGWTNGSGVYKPGQKMIPDIDLRFNAQWAPETQHRHVYDSDYKADALNHWKECVCGAKDTPTAHDFGAWNTTKEPTTSAKGEKERYCKTCNYKETAELDKLSGGQSGSSTSGGSSSGKAPTSAKVTTVSPKTGDNTNVFAWLMVLAISSAGICGVTVYSRKRRNAK